MMMDQAHTVVSSTQACLGVSLRPGGETIARYLETKESKPKIIIM